MKTNSSPKGRFKKGNSGNPSGRPPGSRNKATLAIEQLLEGEGGQLARKAVELAKKGNIQALRLCLERLIPTCKDRRIEMPLKPGENPNDPPFSYVDVMTAIGKGQITPAEGLALAQIMTAHVNSVEAKDLARRVEELESHLDEIRSFDKARSGVQGEALP